MSNSINTPNLEIFVKVALAFAVGSLFTVVMFHIAGG